MNIYVSAGEASGDAYGARLLSHLETLLPDAKFFANGGAKIDAIEGVTRVANSSGWGAVGIAEAIKVGPGVLKDYSHIKRVITSLEPGLFVPIDFGYMHVKLVKHAKKHGWKIAYFIPPGSWRKRPYGGELISLCDKIVVPFEWGLGQQNVRWFGHPLLDLLPQIESISRKDKLAVFLGSRSHEIGPMLVLASRSLRNWPSPLVFALAPSVIAESAARWWREQTGRKHDLFGHDLKANALTECRAGLVCSGTATLEAALCGLPMVVCYPVSAINELQGRLMGLKGAKISLPNILVDRFVVPEFVGSSIDPRQVLGALEKVWMDPSEQLAAFHDVRALCGAPGAIEAAAKWFAESLT